MAYQKTMALNEFEIWEKEARKLVRKAEYSYTKKTSISDYLLCASFFLTHARFENYYKDIIRHAIDLANQSCKPCGEIPGRIRECHVFAQLPHDELKRCYTHGDERSVLDKLHISLSDEPWAWTDEGYVGRMAAEKVINGYGYPSKDNIKKVFYRLGVSDIFAELGRMLKIDAGAFIDEINGLRGSMAHVGLPDFLTPSDVGSKIVQLGRLIRAMDRIIQKRFT